MFPTDFLKFIYYLNFQKLQTHCRDFRWSFGPERAPFQFLQSPGSSLGKPLSHINFLFIRQLNKFTHRSEPGLYLCFLLNSYEKIKIAYTSVEVKTFKIGRLSSCVLPYLFTATWMIYLERSQIRARKLGIGYSEVSEYVNFVLLQLMWSHLSPNKSSWEAGI